MLIRPIRPQDEKLLREAFRLLTPESVYQRFFGSLRELPAEMARRLANVDYLQRLALVAEHDNKAIGVARYEPTDDPGTAEVALAVLDAWQERGLGRILLREILRAAEENGIHRFRADVLSENARMLRLLATEAEIQARRTESGITTFFFTRRG